MSQRQGGAPSSPGDSTGQALAYHERTKHHYQRFAASLGYMDWANQPDPFRRFDGAPRLELPFVAEDDSPPYDDVYRPGAIAPRELDLASLGAFFEHAMALSAWKEIPGRARWSLRIDPSSGNLHPTECYLVSRHQSGAAVYHYSPEHHALEQRAEIGDPAWTSLCAGFPHPVVFVALTSITWREAWKYGERAFRYCNHDVGHALAAIRIGAASLGWQMALLHDTGDDEIAALLGLDRDDAWHPDEQEHPELVAAISPSPLSGCPSRLPGVVPEQWMGQANPLSTHHHAPWDAITSVTEATRKPPTQIARTMAPDRPARTDAATCAARAWQVIRQRRSAVDMDGSTSIPAAWLLRMLSLVMPRNATPWDCWPTAARIHLALFVHRVDGLAPGLYFLVRDPERADEIRTRVGSELGWDPVVPDLPLFRLATGDVTSLAARVSCGQDIAGDGAFSLGMFSELEPALAEHGPWYYRWLFWETGMIGQVLYLEAEAAGVRSTGIG